MQPTSQWRIGCVTANNAICMAPSSQNISKEVEIPIQRIKLGCCQERKFPFWVEVVWVVIRVLSLRSEILGIWGRIFIFQSDDITTVNNVNMTEGSVHRCCNVRSQSDKKIAIKDRESRAHNCHTVLQEPAYTKANCIILWWFVNTEKTKMLCIFKNGFMGMIALKIF